MNPFANYLICNKTDYATAAKELDISRAYVGQIAAGKSTPSLKLIKRIAEWSKGAVPVTAW